MKTKSFLLSVSLVLITVISAEAQGFHLGIKGGANITKIQGEEFDQSFKYGYSLGAFAQIDFNSKWGIQPEVLFNQSQTKTSSDFNDPIRLYHAENVTLDYLTIPILLTYRPIPLISLQVGPQFGALMGQPSNLGPTINKAFKSGDFSAVGGAQVNFGAFKAGARYIIGLNNVNDIGTESKWKNQGIQIYVGLRII